MRVDDRGKRGPVVLSREVPVVGPGKLGVAHALAGVRHALEAEIGGVGEHGGEHRVRVVVGLAATQGAPARRLPRGAGSTGGSSGRRLIRPSSRTSRFHCLFWNGSGALSGTSRRLRRLRSRRVSTACINEVPLLGARKVKALRK